MQINPVCASVAYYNIAVVYDRLGDNVKARENFRKSVQARYEQ